MDTRMPSTMDHDDRVRRNDEHWTTTASPQPHRAAKQHRGDLAQHADVPVALLPAEGVADEGEAAACLIDARHREQA
eukprot:gene6191-biopygen12635